MEPFIQLARKRFSSRKYTSQPIEEEKLIRVLEAARIAPSAANKQPWIFYVIKEPENLKKICEAYHREWLKDAPVIIVACAEVNQAWVRAMDGKNHADIDLAIAIDHMTLQATELGLCTCWVCNFDINKCIEILLLKENIKPIAIIPLAYPADSPDINRHANQRKPLSTIIHWEF